MKVLVHLVIGILGEQRHLAGRVAPIGTAGISVYQLTDGVAISHLWKERLG
jgi:hypothetical protein